VRFSEREVLFSRLNTQSLAGTLFNIRLDNMLPSGYRGQSSTINLATVQLITPPELRDEVLNAIAHSIQVCFVHHGVAAALYSRHIHLDDLDVVLSVPGRGSSRKPFYSRTHDATGLSRCALQLTILMKSTFAQESGKSETDEQAQTPSKEKGDLESAISS
jgi:hypothetical protein